MQLCHYYLKRGYAIFRMLIDRYSPAVVYDRYTSVLFQHNLYPAAFPDHRLIYGVIHHLIDKMMQTMIVGAAYVHARPFADSLKSFENLNILCCIFYTHRFTFERFQIPEGYICILADFLRFFGVLRQFFGVFDRKINEKS